MNDSNDVIMVVMLALFAFLFWVVTRLFRNNPKTQNLRQRLQTRGLSARHVVMISVVGTCVAWGILATVWWLTRNR